MQSPLLQGVLLESQVNNFDNVINHIEKQTGLQFHYSNIIQPNDSLTILPGEYTIKQLLDTFLFDSDVKYFEVKGGIVISPRKKIDAKSIEVKGKVTTKKGQRSVAFASVYMLNNALGTITNFNGNFKLIIPDSLWTDTLVVTAMGYEEVKIVYKEFSKDELNIELEVQRIPIKYVIVRPTEPDKLVRYAYQKRRENYSTEEHFMYGFFRESNRQDNEYIDINEAILEIIKRPHSSIRNDLVRIEKGRRGSNTIDSKFLNLIVKGGLYNIIRLDVIKYTVPFFSYYADEEYKLWVEKNIIYRNRPTYVVGFDSKYETNSIGYRGKMYIDMQSLAIARVEFEFNQDGIEEAKNLLIQKIPKHYKANLVHAKYQVDYRFYNEKWHLSHVKTEVKFKVRSKSKKEDENFACSFISTSEFVVTGIRSSNSYRIPVRESAGPSDIFVQQIEHLGDNYWDGNNIILPDESLHETLKFLQLEGVIGEEHNFISVDNNESYLN